MPIRRADVMVGAIVNVITRMIRFVQLVPCFVHCSRLLFSFLSVSTIYLSLARFSLCVWSILRWRIWPGSVEPINNRSSRIGFVVFVHDPKTRHFHANELALNEYAVVSGPFCKWHTTQLHFIFLQCTCILIIKI